MIEYTDGTNSKYKVCKFQNVSALNSNTFHTFADVFIKMKNHTTKNVEEFLGRKLEGVEMPQRDIREQYLNISEKKRMETHILPRATFMYNLDIDNEDLVNIPSMNSRYNINNGITTDLITIQTQDITKVPNEDRGFDYLRDIDFTLKGNIRYANSHCFYNVLLDNEMEATELAKQLKMFYPIGSPLEYFASNMRIRSGEDVGMVKDNFAQRYTVESVIPNKMVEYMKANLGITAMEEGESDKLLLDLVQKYSFNKVEIKLDGSTKQKMWVINNEIIPTIVTSAIVQSKNTKGEANTYTVRLEYQVHYIEIFLYKLHSSYSRLSGINQENTVNYGIHHPEGRFATTANVIHKKELIKNCTIYQDLDITFEEGDMEYDNEDPTKILHAKLDLLTIIEDEYLAKFIEYISSNATVEDTDYYNVICKYVSLQGSTGHDTDTGMFVDFEELIVYDILSQVNQSINVIIYVNKPEFLKWKEYNGLSSKSNLSGELMGKAK